MARQGTRRYASVDALRGLTVAAMLLVNNPGEWAHVWWPLEHAAWNGFTPTDLIFPMFLFIAGVSIALGVAPRATAGNRIALTGTVWVRALRIIGLGLVLHLLAWWWLDKPHFRPWGVLQRIGVCFALAGTVAIWLRPRGQWVLLIALLVGYAALLWAGGTLLPGYNAASRLDTALLGPLLYQYDPATGLGHDPEGLLSTLGALASTLLGLRAGDWLRKDRGDVLLGGGVLALALGLLWSQWLPLNKNLWTSSYVLWCGGGSMLLLWLGHALVDLRGWPAVGRSFGVNAIAAYAGSALMVYAMLALNLWEPAYERGFASWIAPLAGREASSAAFAVVFVLVWWAIVRWMDRRGWHLKI
ncbi:MAG TPA: heparan-alpha-glucosaminide N-acetyltransferase domain-containing protein [Stenotrophomonas sp.]|jgi:predicted acyltransferase